MKKILFINYCIYLPGEKAIKRTFYLFNLMKKMNYDVTFLTSDFNHYEKKSRDIDDFYSHYSEYKSNVKFVHMKPYKKNISLIRFKNNYLCEKEILKWFIKNGNSYDIVYISWPMYMLVNKIKKYCDIYNVKIILDINDLWPESLKMVIQNNTLYHILTLGLKKQSNKALNKADGLIAVSNEYLNIARKYNHHSQLNEVVYIGSMIDEFDKGINKYIDTIKKDSNEIWLTYIGTLGKSYDIETAIIAIDKLRKSGLNIRLKILGQGPTEKYLKHLIFENNYDGTDFIGFLPYQKMAAYLKKSDICLNCIKKRASQSIINKASDYFTSGNPILNCGPSKEMRNLITKYNTGLNYESENISSLYNAILELLSNKDRTMAMGRNSRRLAELFFNREKTHSDLAKEIINI